jgi:aspartyl-tRNA(Asn)/glutamyl-tRNA(Gln) amidotransferase subunit A
MLYGALGRRRLAAGAFLSASDYVNALRHRARLVAEMAAAMSECDLVVTAGWHEPAPEFGEGAVARGPLLTAPFNVTGSPALSICNGFTASGLPLSLQIAGPAFADADVLALGHALEVATPYRSRRPTFAQTA